MNEGRCELVAMRALIVALCIGMVACSGTTAPTAPTTSFSGTWNGTTSQGASITFTVSGEKVTSLSVGYSLGSCSTLKTFSNIAADLQRSPFDLNPPTRLFDYDSSAPERIIVHGLLTGSSAEGTAVFSDFAGCSGSSVVTAVWMATKK